MKYPFDKNVVFAYRPSYRKTSDVMYNIVKHDRFQDLILNLDGLDNRGKYYITRDDLKTRKQNNAIALSLPLGNWEIVKELLRAYYQSFEVKHALIDNVNNVSIKSLVPLIKVLRATYHNVSIGMFGRYYDSDNKVNSTSNYLINSCRSIEIH